LSAFYLSLNLKEQARRWAIIRSQVVHGHYSAQNRKMINTVTKIILCLAIALAGSGSALAQAQQNSDNSSQASVANVRSDESWMHLETLVNTIDSTRDQLTALRTEFRASEDEVERERLAMEVEQLAADMESLQTAWEMMATGGADLNLFGVKTETAFNWRDELQSVFEPILLELKKLTERPRKIERLRTDKAYYQQRLDVAEEALASVIDYRKNAPSPLLQDSFVRLEDRWRHRRDNLKNRLDLINFELQEMFAPTKASQRDPVAALQDLLSGRVLNLLIAIAVMGAVYLLLRLLSRIYNKLVMHKAHRPPSFMARLGDLLFYLFTTLLVMFSGMVVLYLLGDWLLLGIFIIVLAGAAWAIQRSLPHYLMEAKLILNLGSVREGERVIYRDLPWQVNALSFYTTLINPQLEGGLLRVPLRELVDYNSRQYDAAEAWFPSRVGDYVMLDDGSYGQVIAQTPETVQLKVMGALKTYRTTSFIEQNPRNLSLQGFTLMMTFGLDYQHQEQVTSSIRETMQQELTEGLSQTDMAQYQTQLAVEFKEAAASSLDLIVITSFNGDAADRYFAIQRLLQRLAVDACNRHGWDIPFNQITVHSA